MNNTNLVDFIEIESIESAGIEDVFDLNVPETSCFFANGMLVHNCSEIPLSANYDSCRLLLVNAASYVKNKFTSKSQFDWVLFSKHVQKAQRLMDDLVDLEIECIQKIIDKIESDPETDEIKSVELNLWKNVVKAGKDGRRTGLGMTGIGDVLAYLGMRYGSEESVLFVEKLYSCFAVAAELSGTILAEERGNFAVYDYNLEKNNPYLLRVAACSSEFEKRWKKFGRRNISLTTTAPCGSVSVLTQTTSGIEPAYLLHYKRRKKINQNDTTSRVDFVDQLGDKWQEFDVYHHGLRDWMKITGETDITKSPYWDSTADKIDWSASVDLQAAAQKYISHAISKTCNLPSSVTVDLVSDVYKKAWHAGLKGFTVYRDGSRTGVLVSADKKDKTKEDDSGQPVSVVESHAPKRPKDLPCDIHRVTVKGDQYLVLVGLLDGKPYEIFAGLSEYVEIPKKIKNGILVKNGKKDGVSTYNLSIPLGDDDHMTFKDVVELFQNKTHGAFTRTISLCLRHGIPVQYLSDQLRKDKHSDITSFSNVIARVLSKSYIIDDNESSDKTCPSCNNKSLLYQEGCLQCSNCGYSKCS